MIPFRNNVIIYQFETQTEFANQMYKYILDEKMDAIVFNDKKEIFLKKPSRFIRGETTDEHIKEIEETFKDWVIVLSTKTRVPQKKDSEKKIKEKNTEEKVYFERKKYTEEYIQSKIIEAMDRYNNKTEMYPEYFMDWYWVNRDQCIERKRERRKKEKKDV